MRLLRNLCALFVVAAMPVSARAGTNTLALSATPMAVQRVINVRTFDGKLGSISKTFEGGENTFDVVWTEKGGKEGGFTVAEDGTLLSVEVEFSEMPAALQNAIHTAANGCEFKTLQKDLSDPANISYDARVSKDGREWWFTVDDEGGLMSKEVTLAETPASVQAAVQKKAADSQIKTIDQNFEDETTFDVTITKGGVETSFTVSASGAVLSEQVALDDVPQGARKTIREHLADGTLLRIDKSLSEKKGGVLPFEVQGRKDGKPFNFSVGPKGRFLGMDD